LDDGERITAESAVGVGTEFGQEGFEAAVQETCCHCRKGLRFAI